MPRLSENTGKNACNYRKRKIENLVLNALYNADNPVRRQKWTAEEKVFLASLSNSKLVVKDVLINAAAKDFFQ